MGEVDDEVTESSDAVIMASLLEGRMSHHRLEQDLGDAQRAATLRRTYLEAATAAKGTGVSFDGLPVESMDTQTFYSSVVGTNCENVVGYIPIPVGVVGPLVIDGVAVATRALHSAMPLCLRT